MTTALAPQARGSIRPGQAPPARTLSGALAGVGEVARTRIALGAVGSLAAGLYIWNLAASGYANAYYAAAAQAASQSWTAWFFGSLDAGNFITVDKPPLATMLMGLSVRLFGLGSWSILLPQALLGVATVLLLFQVVRRAFGPVAATIAATAMALTPVAALMFRYDHPDALLTFLFVAGAWAVQRAIEDGRHRWLVVAGTAVGLAFLTKYLQAFLVVPAFGFAYAVAAQGSVRRRIAGLAVFAMATFVSSAWWVLAVELTPASLRPYVGGSTNNSVLDLIFGYDGLGRILGQGGGSGGASGTGFSGTPGLLRLFNAEFGGQISWLLPLAFVSLCVGLIVTLRSRRTDLPRAAYLLWGGWLAVHAVVFSYMSGIVHSYYAVAMAPAVAGLVGAGVVQLWRVRDRFRVGGVLLAVSVAATSAWASILLARSPQFVPGLGTAIVVVGLGAAAVLAVPILRRSRTIGYAAAGVAFAAMLAGPAAYSLATATSAYSGPIVSAGPATTASNDGATGGPQANARGGSGPTGAPPNGSASLGAIPTPPGGSPVGASAGVGGGGTGTLDQATIDYLVANRGGSTWIVAVNDALSAAQLELQTGSPVMGMGGWSGSDAAPTLDELKADVASGKLRFVLVSSLGGGGRGTSSEIASWVVANGTAVAISGSSASGWTLYDLGGATGTAG